MNKQMETDAKQVGIKDVPLQELVHRERLSVRATNVCKNNRLFSLHRILTHYLRRRTFSSFRNCGRTTNEELCQLCQKYLEQNSKMDAATQDFSGVDSSPLEILEQSIEYYQSQNSLSQQTTNVCANNDLYSLGDVLNYYNTYHTFRKLPGCGAKAERELTRFCLEMEHELLENLLESIGNEIDFSSWIPNYSLDELAHHFGFSARTTNVCSANGLESHDDILHHYNPTTTFRRFVFSHTYASQSLCFFI